MFRSSVVAISRTAMSSFTSPTARASWTSRSAPSLSLVTAHSAGGHSLVNDKAPCRALKISAPAGSGNLRASGASSCGRRGRRRSASRLRP